MQFTVTIKNKLTNTEHTFQEWFGIEECFDNSKETFNLLVKALEIENPDVYDSVEELIDYHDTDLEQYLDIFDLNDFGTDIISCNATYSDISELYELDIEIEKIKAYQEYNGSISITDILYINWDDIYLYKNIDNHDDLGRYIIEDVLGGISELTKEELEQYFDYEKYGRDYAISQGSFTSEGFIEMN